MEFLAPAKINLSLRVIARRGDGFHEIETLVSPISIFDTLDIELKESGGLEFSCSDSSLLGADNLVVKAVNQFCGSFGFTPNLRVHLTKDIPYGAGLGGGSSDAATTLIALDHLFQTHLPREELSELATELGSDVPCFLWQNATWCRGRGEKVEAAILEKPIPLLLVKPPFEVSTPWAYRHWQGSREIPGVSYAEQPFPWGTLVNELERPVFEKHLQLAHLKSWLLAQPETEGALMSGSGSTVFAILKENTLRTALALKVTQEFGSNLWMASAETV